MPVLKGTRLQGSTFGYKSDPLFSYTTLLLPGVGTNGANNNVFVDASTNNFAITRNGNATQGTFSPFSPAGWSGYFDGSSYLRAPSAAWTFGTNSLTVEAWIFPTTVSGSELPVFKYHSSSQVDGATVEIRVTNGKVVGNIANSSAGGNTPISPNVWTHVALVKNGSTATLYINGVAETTTVTYASSLSAPTTITISANQLSNYFYSGYIGSLRVLNGTALVPPVGGPTSPLTAITNTVLLTLQNNRFIDASSNNFTFTISGTPKIQNFSPFAPTAEYTPSIHGGSGYFDGSGDDVVTSTTSSAFAFGTNDFSVEAWVYITADTSTTRSFWQNGAGDNCNLQRNTSGNLQAWDGADRISTTSVPSYAWNHVAFTRASGTARLFVNGVLALSWSSTVNYSTNTTWVAGYTAGGLGRMFGYINDLRVVKGSIPTAYQTSSTTVGAFIFTPPTAPLTAITNTSLLLNFTNAGIYDATGKNNLETVADAKISNTTAKFGSTSIALTNASDYLRNQQASALWDFGTGNWTIESWIYPTTLSASTATMLYSGSASSFVIALYTNKVRIFENSVSTYKEYTLTLSTNTWQHIAVVRNTAISPTVYVNGTGYTTGSSYTGVYGLATDYPEIGYDITYPSEKFYGYLQDFRITKGIARYTANFTPQASYLPLR